MHFESTILPIVIVAIVFGMPVLIVAIVFTFINRNNTEKQKTLRMAIEKSDSLSPELLDQLKDIQKKPRTPMRDIRAGIILIAVAAGLMAWSYIDRGHIGGGLSGIAAIPGLIGVALLVLGLIGSATRKN
jgi:hypothetical protein